MFYNWLNWLFGITLEIDGHLNLLSTDTIRLATNVYYKNVKPEITAIYHLETVEIEQEKI